MNPVTLKLKKKIKYRMDMSFLSNPYKDISKLSSQIISYGNKQFKIKELFSIKGNDIKNIIIQSSVDLMDNIGKESSNVNITVYGNVGYSFGEQMLSGKLILHGNALDYAASGVKGGSIFIYGNSGDYTGGKTNHGNIGIVDGFLYVKGNVGNNSIERMRRGNVIIEGNIGDYACNDMISGTIIIKGKIGKIFAEGMKRGTIFTKDKKVVKEYAKSNDAEYNFTNFYFKEISNIISKRLFLENKKLIRYCGNTNSNNFSEVFLFKL
jgi:formylmethanofuran dehydrogenase subunit C